MQQIDHSLERPGMDYVDLYINHRWECLASSKRIWMLCTIW